MVTVRPRTASVRRRERPRTSRVLTDALREVARTRSRFVSILVLSALAVAFLAGLRSTAPDMERSADAYFDAQNLMDIQVLSTLGLTDEDLAVLGTQEGVQAAEGAWTADAVAKTGDQDTVVKLHSISDAGINRPRLVEGRLPQAQNECLVEPDFLTLTGLSLGDTVTLDTGTGDYEDALAEDTFTVVGTADSPLYVSVERGTSTMGTGKVSAFLLLPRSAFTMETYTEAYLTLQGARGLLSYGQEYKDLAQGLIDALEPMGEERAALRYDSVVGDAQTKLDDANAELEKAQADADRELADAWAELSDGRAELDEGWADYYDGQATLNREVAEAKAELADAFTELTDGENDYAQGLAELADGWRDYDEGAAELADGKREYAEALPDLEEGEAEYNDALVKLQDGEKEYAEGLTEYQDGMEELAQAGADLTDAAEELEDAADQLFAGGQQLSAGQSQYEAQVSGLNTLLSAVWGVVDQTNDELVDRMRDPLQQTADWGAIEYAKGLDPTLGAALEQAFPTANGIYGYIATAAALDSARAELASGQSSLSWGWTAYQTGMEQYRQGVKDLEAGAAELQDAYAELTDARRELDDGWVELRKGRRELDNGWAQLDEARQKLTDGEVELADAYTELTDGAQELADARGDLDQGWADYFQGQDTLVRETADGQKELADAYVELTDGETEYADGLAEYQEGKDEAETKISDARRELNDAQRKVDEIEDCQWYILGRGANPGYASFQADADRMGNLASVFPLIFFLVAALVALTTMTRMVEEQRVQIGGMKALGYGKGAIAVKYVGYGAAASLLGGLAGLAVGVTLIPAIIYSAWGALYTLGALKLAVYPAVSLLSAGAAAGTVTLAALGASWSALAAVPAALMRPKAPPLGKRVLLERLTPVWRRLSFAHKVTVRNLFRYKKRFWMTVIGIAGCTALLVTGFGLRDSIFDVLELQYGKINLFSAQIGLARNVTDSELTEIARELDTSADVARWDLFQVEAVTAEATGGSYSAYVFAQAGQTGLEEYLKLGHRKDDEPVALTGDGAVISEKLAQLLGLSVGDELTLDGDERVTVRVADVTEQYVQHFVYLSSEYYQRVYGGAPAGNLILADYADPSAEAARRVSAALVPLSGVSSVTWNTDVKETYESGMTGVNHAVAVITAAAAALAFVVLYNLTNINITERRRELATLKVLGFYDREMTAYVYRENVALTVFGIALGLGLGALLHRWLVGTVEIDMLMFGRSVHPVSYAIAMALTVLFSALVNLSAHRKLQGIDMVESLKSLE